MGRGNDEETVARLCERALMTIRASALLRQTVDAPPEFTGDYTEWIRLLADACDGLAAAGVRGDAEKALSYRRSVWQPVQAAWAESVIRS